MRLAVVDPSLCKPSKCNRECVRFCPVNRSGANCIVIEEELKRAIISESLCVGCGICVKKCPYEAVSIVNLPEKLKKDVVHRYGPNLFELFRLPIPKPGKIVGLIGMNGVGKSTSLKILGGVLKPNLGNYEQQAEWKEIIRFFRGSELQPYFEKLAANKLRAVLKPQAVDKISKLVKGTVREVLEKADEKGDMKRVVEELNLNKVLDREVDKLSGGELQKLAIAALMLKDANVYLIDEPSSYLDVKERLRVAKAIRSLASENNYVVVVEHDLAVLDYISDLVHILYGEPGVYGIVSLPRGVRTGINAYIQGFLREENIRIRDKPIEFHARPTPTEWTPEQKMMEWSDLEVNLGGFKLKVEGGEIHKGEVIGILGPNGIGKTTFVRILAGKLKPDSGYIATTGEVRLSYKPQFIAKVDYQGTLRQLLEEAKVNIYSSFVQTELLHPLRLKPLLDRKVNELSGGELQRAIIAVALGREADIYLLDEPMAYLDVEQRYAVARVIKRLTQERHVATFVVEHDIVAQDFLATSLMVFTGKPGVEGYAYAPMGLRKGMNKFLEGLGITFRRDLETGRPRINKEGSWLDRYQKEVLKEYYYIPTKEEPEEPESSNI